MPSNIKLKKLRVRALQKQGGLCIYCGAKIWESDPHDFIAQHRATPAQAAALRCTAEHLRALSDGGTTDEANIAAACFRCNQSRHRRKRPPNPEQFKRSVRDRVAKRKWHQPWVFAADLFNRNAAPIPTRR